MVVASLLYFNVECVAQIVKVTEFGVRPDTGQDVSSGVLRAIKAAKARPGAVLQFPKGRYDFWPVKEHFAHYFISNHDAVDNRAVAIPLEGAKHLTLDGQGSAFVFHGPMLPISIVDATDVTLRNFSVDYETQHFLTTKVMAAVGDSVTVTVLAGQKYSVSGGRLTLFAEGWSAQATASLEIDPATMAVALNARDNFKLSAARIAEGLPGELMISGLPSDPKIGHVLLFRAVDRPDPAIWTSNSKNISVKNVAVHSALGMAFLAQKSQDIHVDGLDVTLTPGSGRYITTNADALHFSNCKGKLLIENGIYENMLDDGINVHGSYLRVEKLIAPRTVLLAWGHPQTFGFTFAEKGELLEFVASRTSLPYFRAHVTDAMAPDDHHVQIVLDRDMPSSLHVGDNVDNVDWRPTVVYRHNTVRRIRSRGALFSTTSGVLVEDNRFENLSSAGVMLPETGSKWFESTPSRDVAIRRNTFRDTNLAQPSQGAILIGERTPSMKPDDGYNYSNVSIEDNDFELLEPHVLQASSVDGLLFRANRLAISGDYSPQPFHATASVTLAHSRCIHIENNTFPAETRSVPLREIDTSLVRIDKQPGTTEARDWDAVCSRSAPETVSESLGH
jgi:hypothetical protein